MMHKYDPKLVQMTWLTFIPDFIFLTTETFFVCEVSRFMYTIVIYMQIICRDCIIGAGSVSALDFGFAHFYF